MTGICQIHDEECCGLDCTGAECQSSWHKRPAITWRQPYGVRPKIRVCEECAREIDQAAGADRHNAHIDNPSEEDY